MQKSSVGGWAPWGHIYFCVGVRLTELTVRALTKRAVSEPVPTASFKIHSSFNKSDLEEKFLITKSRGLCVSKSLWHIVISYTSGWEKLEFSLSQAWDFAFA